MDPEFDLFIAAELGGRNVLELGTDWERFDVLLLLLPTDSYPANLDIWESHDNLVSFIGDVDKMKRGEEELEGEWGLPLSMIVIGAVLVARVEVRSLM